jgi:hypothetical protein
MSLCFGEQEMLTADHVFILFHPKFEMSIYMKVVSLDKLDNFHIGRFSYSEHATKVPEDIQRH